MKKALILCLILLTAVQSGASASYWKAKDIFYKFDFTNSKVPEYSVISGDWSVGAVGKEKIFTQDFDTGKSGFSPVSGAWTLNDGKYFQTEEGVSSTTRSLTAEKYTDFSMSFELTPLSEENTMMIYFGYENEGSFNSVEINSYQSKLILGGAETVGKGSIIKDNTYEINLVLNEGKLALFCNSELILEKSDMSEISGRVGIGTWNSKAVFDNFKLVSVPALGIGEKLIGSGEKEALAVFSELSADNFVITAPVAASAIYGGEIGIGARLSKDGDGYYAGINKNSVYIAKKSNGRKKLIKKEIFKPQSEKFYEMSVICDGNKILLEIDGEEMLSVTDDEFSRGMCGFFAKETKIYCKNVTMSLLEEVSPPVISKGETVYYIDDETGNDCNDGKTPETAWKGTDKLSQCSFADGDKILFKRGMSYEGTVNLKDISAKFDKPLIISAYGDGDAPILTACGVGISIENCKNIQISGIDVKLRHFGMPNNLWTGKGYGIYVSNSQNITVTDSVLNGPGSDTDSIAIETGDKRTFDELTMENVIFSDFGIGGICINGVVGEKSDEDGEIKNHWAYKYMKSLIQKNVITEYRPDDRVTRAEFSTMLISALSLNQSEYRGIFKDVTADMWFAPKLQTVSDYRLLPNEMTAGNNAKPDEPLKREEAAAMSVLACGAELEGGCEYNDIKDCEEWTVKYIETAAALGIMSGKGDGGFYPKESLTRAEAAVILLKITAHIGGEA